MKVDIIKKETIDLEEYWLVRGIKDDGKKKEVIAEWKFATKPNNTSIAQILINNPNIDFCSIEHNYRID